MRPWTSRVWEKVVSLTRERAEAKSFGRSPISAIYAIVRHSASFSAFVVGVIRGARGDCPRAGKGAIMTAVERMIRQPSACDGGGFGRSGENDEMDDGASADCRCAFCTVVVGRGPADLVRTVGRPVEPSCDYYYPVRTFHRALPLSHSCPTWARPD